MGIAEFLEARWAERAAAAKVATQGEWTADLAVVAGIGSAYLIQAGPDDLEVALIQTCGGPLPDDGERADAEHIALNDPAAVLADIEAKRAILADRWGGPDHEDMWEHHVRLLAVPFASHPDYDPSWRPEA